MFLYLTAGSVVQYMNLRGNAAKHITEQTTGKPIAAIINAHIDMRAANGEVVIGWLASQTDMLSENWQVVD